MVTVNDDHLNCLQNFALQEPVSVIFLSHSYNIVLFWQSEWEVFLEQWKRGGVRFFPLEVEELEGCWKIEVRRWLKKVEENKGEKSGVRVPTGCTECRHIQ